MTAITTGATVAVTGASGYIGGWVVRDLLDLGYAVRACVRDPNDAEKTGFLTSMPEHATRRLTLHAADLDQPGCFDDIFPGCDGVAHVSHVSSYADAQYVRGVCDHVIASINSSQTVSRVIVTSSIAAVMSEADLQEVVRRPVFDETRWPDESNPKRTPERGHGYSIGKVVAERSFWDAAEKSGRWDAIAVCPGDNLGPILSPHHHAGAWQHIVEQMLTGRYFQTPAYRPWMTVDVRDDARCHVGLLECTKAGNGDRFIACSTERRDAEDICLSIPRLLPHLAFVPPQITDPFPDRIRAREAELRAIWAQSEIRNDKIRDAIGVVFRPLDDSIRDCVESLLTIAGVVPRTE
jgi:nucleoside-diphosphate-sugar epimerase